MQRSAVVSNVSGIWPWCCCVNFFFFHLIFVRLISGPSWLKGSSSWPGLGELASLHLFLLFGSCVFLHASDLPHVSMNFVMHKLRYGSCLSFFLCVLLFFPPQFWLSWPFCFFSRELHHLPPALTLLDRGCTSHTGGTAAGTLDVSRAWCCSCSVAPV